MTRDRFLLITVCVCLSPFVLFGIITVSSFLLGELFTWIDKMPVPDAVACLIFGGALVCFVGAACIMWWIRLFTRTWKVL